MTTKEMLRSEYAKVWGKDQKMADYCAGKVASFAVLPDGGIVPVEKQQIEKHFCFGESGYDYDDAQKAAAHARTSESYFKSENMKHYRRWISALQDVLFDTSDYRLVIRGKCYFSQTSDCKICGIGFERIVDIIDACGGCCYLDELPGKELDVRGTRCRIATDEEIRLIIEAYKAAAAQHEKKVDAYLKRYGTSKVHAWTYWRDA